MKITYEFIDGTKNEIEVDDKFGTVIIDSGREERNSNERQRYHCYSYDVADYTDINYTDKNTLETETERKEWCNALIVAVNT